jgi:hypothetical protein
VATSDDLTPGQDRDDALEAIDKLLPEMWAARGIQSEELIALILLDEHYGLRQPGDYVYLNAGIAPLAIMPYTVLDPLVAAAITSEDEPSEAQVQAASERASREPFEVQLTYNPFWYDGEEAPPNEAIPEALRDTVIRVRFMTDDVAADLPEMVTVRADGKVIYLPSEARPEYVS